MPTVIATTPRRGGQGRGGWVGKEGGGNGEVSGAPFLGGVSAALCRGSPIFSRTWRSLNISSARGFFSRFFFRFQSLGFLFCCLPLLIFAFLCSIVSSCPWTFPTDRALDTEFRSEDSKCFGILGRFAVILGCSLEKRDREKEKDEKKNGKKKERYPGRILSA